MSLEIAGRRIARAAPLFVVAEIGLNHGGSLTRALSLVDAAADAGASAVKAQVMVADDLIAANCPAPAHVAARSLGDFFRQFELDRRGYAALCDRAHARGLAFMATPFSKSAVDMLETLHVDAYKVASGDATYFDLIAHLARTGKPLVLSSGMATLDEMSAAVIEARLAGARRIAVMHCVSAYPVPAGSENLLAISTLRHALRVAVGLSDHGADASAVPMAIALGATLYERHLMLGDDAGVDAAVSSRPSDLAAVVQTAARVQAALGHGRKECLPIEAANVQASRRSLHAARRLEAGHIVAAADIIALRPASGLPLDAAADLIGTALARDVDSRTPFLASDLGDLADLSGERFDREVA